MSLLFDENLSRKLIARLADLFPGAKHVVEAGFERAPDAQIWDFAAKSGLTVVSKDGDFAQRLFLYGPPPSVLWIRGGNLSTPDAEALIRANVSTVRRLHQGLAPSGLLILDFGRPSGHP